MLAHLSRVVRSESEHRLNEIRKKQQEKDQQKQKEAGKKQEYDDQEAKWQDEQQEEELDKQWQQQQEQREQERSSTHRENPSQSSTTTIMASINHANLTETKSQAEKKSSTTPNNKHGTPRIYYRSINIVKFDYDSVLNKLTFTLAKENLKLSERPLIKVTPENSDEYEFYVKHRNDYKILENFAGLRNCSYRYTSGSMVSFKRSFIDGLIIDESKTASLTQA